MVLEDRGMSENTYVGIHRRLTRFAFDDQSVTFFGIMLHPGPGTTTYLDVYCDRPCWRTLLDTPPSFLSLTNEVHVCDSERAVRWTPRRGAVSTPREATGRDETLVHVELPFADYKIYAELLKDEEKLLIPERITSARVFGDPLVYRKPVHSRPIRLAVGEVDALVVRTKLHTDRTMESPTLYERGIPVCPIGLPFHVNLIAVLPDPVPEGIADEVRSQLADYVLPEFPKDARPYKDRLRRNAPVGVENTEFIPGKWEENER
jgi:hypothetical protein